MDGTSNKTGDELTPTERTTEINAVRDAEPRRISEPPYQEEVELPNGHEWKRREDGVWCRFSNTPRGCVEGDENGLPDPNRPVSQQPESATGTPSTDIPDLQNVQPGQRLGSGGNKEVFTVEGNDDLAIAVLKPGKPASSINDEIELLQKLQGEGLPTIEVLGTTTHQGRPAVVMRRYEQGSKDVVRLENKKVRLVGDSELLNERSVEDLNRIRSVMEENQVKIDDLQFLIGSDGSVVIADPLDVHIGQEPSKNNIKGLC